MFRAHQCISEEGDIVARIIVVAVFTEEALQARLLCHERLRTKSLAALQRTLPLRGAHQTVKVGNEAFVANGVVAIGVTRRDMIGNLGLLGILGSLHFVARTALEVTIVAQGVERNLGTHLWTHRTH